MVHFYKQKNANKSLISSKSVIKTYPQGIAMGKKEVKIERFVLIALAFAFLLSFLAFAPFIGLETPTDGQQFLATNSVTFNCSVNDTEGISNISLYHDINGTFVLNQTRHYGYELSAENNLVLLLHFNNDSAEENSTYIKDWSGNNNNGRILNVTYNATGGKYNGGMEFFQAFDAANPTNESIEIPDSDSLDLLANGTIEAWVKPQITTDGIYFIVSKGDDWFEYSSYSFVIQKSSTGCYLQLLFGDGESNEGPLSKFATECNGEVWHHLAATWNSSSISFYVNGEFNKTSSHLLTPEINSKILRIGKNSVQGEKFYGSIDELAIYNTTLTAEQISTHYGNKPNSTSKTWTIQNIPDGNYTWNCLSADNNSETNFSSANKSFLVDANPPAFLEILNSPSDDDGLDPGIAVNITANLSERFGATAILQYKQSGAGSWTNATMTNTSASFYNASFTPGTNGVWNYRIYANDSFGHANTSRQYNLSIEYDYTWSRTPADFGSKSRYFSTSGSIGILTINNTGDYTLNFDLSNNAPEGMTYNYTEPFDLTAKEVRFINITATYGAIAREDNVIISIDATTASASPSNATSNVTLVSYAGGPYFDVRITSYSATANQSSRMNLSAYVNNIGNQTATSTWLNFSLPSGWTNITGNMTFYIGSLAADATAYSNITANISSSASAGVATIIAIAACNESITDNETKTVTLSCSGSDSVCGSGCTYLTDSDCTQETITLSSGGGGGGQAAGGGTTIIIEKEEISYSQIVHIVRGEKGRFSISVNNNFEGATIDNATLDITGFLSRYMSASPAKISGIAYKESREFEVEVSVPSYLEHKNYTLTGIITGNIKYLNKNPKDLLIRQYVLLIVHETSKEQATASLETAKHLLNELSEKGLVLKKAQKMIEEAENALNADEYETAAKLSEQISSIVAKAEESGMLIASISEGIKNAEYFGLKAEETKNIINLAKAAFEREDFETALARAKEAEVLIALETEGKINIANFIIRNWYFIFAAMFILSIGSLAGYRQVSISLSAGRLEKLANEESGIAKLMKEAQRKAFEEKSIGLSEYYKEMLNYEERLRKIRIKRARLRARRTGSLSMKEELKSLESESAEVLGLLKTAQENYFEKGNLTKRKYEDEKESARTRLAEIEEAKALLEARIREKRAKK